MAKHNNKKTDLGKIAAGTVDDYKVYKELCLQVSEAKQLGSFSNAVLDWMIRRNLTTRDLYDRALISRSLYSKIINTPEYRPCRETVFLFIIAFRLSLADAIRLLELAGFAFACNQPREAVIRCCLENNIYDLNSINAVLSDCGLSSLGFKIRKKKKRS